MQLQSLIISGFKSFPEAKVEFPRGITAVVGPNGSGKSNIVDALLWVLGEQSTKALRSERMEDVIFNGTETKKPLGMADVSLVLSHITPKELEALSGVVEDLGARELMVTRRLYRDGESEYLINQIPCRLKDIRGLFLEARAGTRGHTVIEQGNIDQILSASPQERRSFIEETAGIGRYKKQKTEALRKLQATEQNLLRVRDIIAEVKRQLRSLERQARQAEVYQTLRHEIRDLELALLRADYVELTHQREAGEAELHRWEAAESEYMAHEAHLMVDAEKTKAALHDDSARLSGFREDLRRLEQEMSQALTAIEVHRNRLRMYEEQRQQGRQEAERLAKVQADVETKLQHLQTEVSQLEQEVLRYTDEVTDFEREAEDLAGQQDSTQERIEEARQRTFDIAVEKNTAENHLKHLSERRLSLVKRRERLETERQVAETERDRLVATLEQGRAQCRTLSTGLDESRAQRGRDQSNLDELHVRVQQLDESVVSGQTELAAAESRLRALKAIFEEECGYGNPEHGDVPAIRTICAEIQEAFVERLEVAQEYEAALETVLGEKIRAWVVDRIDDASQVVEKFKTHHLGRGIFVPAKPLESRVVEDPVPAWWGALQQAPGVIGRALDLVHVPGDLASAWSSLLDQVVIVKDLDAAIRIVQNLPAIDRPALQLVTLAGELVLSTGVVIGGSSGESTGILQRRREIRELEHAIQDLTRQIDESRTARQKLSAECDLAKSRMTELDEAIKQSEMRVAVEEKELTRIEEDVQESRHKIDVVCQEQEASRAEHSQIDQEEESCRVRLAGLEQEQTEREQSLRDLQDVFDDLEHRAFELQERLTDSQVMLNTKKERMDHYQEELRRLNREYSESQSSLQGLHERLGTLDQHIQESQEEQARSEYLFQELDHRKSSLQVEMQAVEDRHQEALGRSRELDDQLTTVRRQFSEAREQRSDVEVKLAGLRTRLETLNETLQQTYALTVEQLLAQSSEQSANAEAVGSDASIEVLRQRLQELRAKAERMGPINLAAIEEHRELEERFAFLTKQEQDLSESIQSLKEIIERLNQTTDRKFEETFQTLQEKFSEVFAALFAGGKAELILVQPEVDAEGIAITDEPGVDIVAQPPGKRLKSLAMLSGGEKTLTVLALLFASFLINPSPFCILDEVDAPLDEPNVVRFARFLQQMADRSQFVVITHNKRTMEIADSLFGVTMEEPGVSKFVAVRLADFETVGR